MTPFQLEDAEDVRLTPSSTMTSPEAGTATALASPVSVSIRNLRKEFRRRSGDRVVAIDNVSLDIKAGQLVVLLGPSGCGKTTLLRCIAGLEQPDSGRIEISGRCVFDSEEGISLPTERRDISMMFQSYALWPHMTAFENIEYAVRSRGRNRAYAEERCTLTLEQIRISELRNSYPSQMSGGQQQRVALARALAVEPQVILFDEPLSNVDAKLRDQLRLELALMQRRLHFSGVYVTHDQIEALQLADLVAVMGRGRIHQLGTPKQVYNAPTSKYVATFIGQANDLPANVLDAGTGTTGADILVRCAIGDVRCRLGAGTCKAGDTVSLVVRPENVQVSEAPTPDFANCWKAAIEATIFSGVYSDYRIAAGDTTLVAWTAQRDLLSDDKDVFITIDPDQALAFPQEH